MASNISSSNYYSVSASSNNGMAGLVSGMDTEGMVKQMLSGTQTKIDKVNQQKQQIDWKTEIYHDVISTINNFKSTYIDTTYDSSLRNNIASNKFFNTMKSSLTSGSSIRVVSTDSSAQAKDMSVKVMQLASATRLDSRIRMSGDQSILGGDINLTELERGFSASQSLSFDLTLDGVTKTITVNASDFDDTGITTDKILDVVKARTKNAFGSYIGVDMVDNKLKFSVNIMDEHNNVESGHELRITGAEASFFGLTAGASSLATSNTKLGDLQNAEGDDGFSFTINGQSFSFTKDTSISAMMHAINSSSAGAKMSYSSMTDSFSIVSSNTGKQFEIDISQEKGNVLSLMFGETVISKPVQHGNAGSLTAGAVQAGKDAIIEIDKVVTSRSSNTFTIDGLTITALKETGEENIISTERDVDTIVDGIKSFVEDYNKMMKKLTTLISEKAEYRNYAPLTSAQEEKMSENQITKWEEKAKTGLVRNDSEISMFVDTMKSLAYSKPTNAGISLFSIGIDTKAWDSTGQLVIDEAKLRSAIVSDPDAVRALFTDSDKDAEVKGLASQITEISDKVAKVSSADTGSLVRLSGAKDFRAGEKNNDYYFELLRLNDRLSVLQSKYETERSRYWSQFSNMEKILANYSSQSSLINQQFGS